MIKSLDHLLDDESKRMNTYYDQPSPKLPRICTAGSEKIIAPRLRQKLAADTTDAEIGK